jgi:putative ABC transport system substrate-binding protein
VDVNSLGAILTVILTLLATPLAAEAQGTVPRIGLLDNGSFASRAPLWEAFRQGMRELGYVEGRTVIFEPRSADGQYERLPALAAELVRLKVDVIVATGTAAHAAKQATATIPIVTTSGDPLATGLVASLARPAGNVTGLTTQTAELSAKRVGLARDLVPGASRFAILWSPQSVNSATGLRETEAAARTSGWACRPSASRIRRSSTGPSRPSRRRVPGSSSTVSPASSPGSAAAWQSWP